MKTLFNKFLSLVICTCALVFVAPFAKAQTVSQLEEKTLPVGEFSSINVSDDFSVSLVKGSYSVRLTTDKVLAPYVQVYVRSKVLYITYDNKSVPKDIKKQYKGKGVPAPVFRAVVYLPELNGITLQENASVTSVDEFRGGTFTMDLQDKAQIKGLKLHANSIQLNLKKNSQATLDVTCDQKAEISTDGNANLVIGLASPSVSLNTSGSSVVAISGESPSFTLNAGGSSEVSAKEKNENTVLNITNSADVVLSGETVSLQLNSEKNADLDASNYTAKTVEAVMTDGKANVNVLEELSVTLTGGSTLYYAGTPVFKIGKIIKSTLSPLGVTK